jgi:hypothetical protein
MRAPGDRQMFLLARDLPVHERLHRGIREKQRPAPRVGCQHRQANHRTPADVRSGLGEAAFQLESGSYVFAIAQP